MEFSKERKKECIAMETGGGENMWEDHMGRGMEERGKRGNTEGDN